MAPAARCPLVVESLSVRVRNTFIDVLGELSPQLDECFGQRPQSCPAVQHAALQLQSFCMDWAEDASSPAKSVEASSPQSTEALLSEAGMLESVSTASHSEQSSEADEESFQDCSFAIEDMSCTPTFDDLPVCDFFWPCQAASGFAGEGMYFVDEGVLAQDGGENAFFIGEFAQHAPFVDAHSWLLLEAQSAGQVPMSSAAQAYQVPSEPRVVLSLADALESLPVGTEPQKTRASSAGDEAGQDVAIGHTAGDATESLGQQLEVQFVPNPGSASHESGDCKPCAFFHANRCDQGAACHFCHLCDSLARKRMKKDKFASKKALRRAHIGMD